MILRLATCAFLVALAGCGRVVTLGDDAGSDAATDAEPDGGFGMAPDAGLVDFGCGSAGTTVFPRDCERLRR